MLVVLLHILHPAGAGFCGELDPPPGASSLNPLLGPLALLSFLEVDSGSSLALSALFLESVSEPLVDLSVFSEVLSPPCC